jgi:hypothetical protein
MNRSYKHYPLAVVLGLLIFAGFSELQAQRYLTGTDTSGFMHDTLRPFFKRFENIRITGYIQPQFQVASSDGAQSYAGGNFSTFSRSRFMLRRARLKVDYLLMKNKYPQALFSFQIDGTERGVVIKDVFIRLYETVSNNVSLMAGFFPRPFGYEVNLGSSHRESPERGRMSQILMPGERDLGFMVIYEPQDTKKKLSHLRWDAGLFNGQGQSGATDFDSHKDFISRLTIKPYAISKMELSGAFSLLLGGWKNGTKYVYETRTLTNGIKKFVVDSLESNLGKSSPRHYYGADLQWKLKHKWGATELRGEYWFGEQPGTSESTTNPGTLPNSNGLPVPTYVRHFNGAFFYFLQNIFNEKHQLILKYDWYDPNARVETMEIGQAGSNFTGADIKYSTWGFGYAYHLNPQTKLVLYYDRVKNESTLLTGSLNDQPDNVFTCRLQFRF